MVPEPNFENSRKLHQKLCEKLETILYTLSTSYGHRGMVKHLDVYHELGDPPLVYPTYPDFRPPYPTHLRIQKYERKVVYENWAGRKETWDTLINLHQATRLTLCESIPSAYRRNPATVKLGWSINVSNREMLELLDDY